MISEKAIDTFEKDVFRYFLPAIVVVVVGAALVVLNSGQLRSVEQGGEGHRVL